MSKRKLVLCLGLFVCLSLPFACGPGCEDENNLTTVTELSVSFGPYSPNFRSRESVPFDSAAFSVSIEEVVEEAVAFSDFQGFSPVLMAESCAYITSLKYNLEAINITSSAAITIGGQVYEAGANLNALFAATLPYGPIEQSISTFIDEINTDSFEFSARGSNMFLQLVQRPDQELRQTFTFEYVFEQGSVAATTSEVVITLD